MRVLLAFALAAAAACGPNAGRGDPPDGPTDAPGTGTLHGVVWAPGMAPGMVPARQEIPIAGALVSLELTRPAPIPAGVYCQTCVSTGGGVLTDARGGFELTPLVPGDYWLVIQKGQFRLEQEIRIEEGVRGLPAAMTTLPSELDPARGMTIPKIAIAVGNNDSIEDVTGKMGLGQVGADGDFTSTLGELDLYTNGGPDLGMAMGTLTQLVSDLDRLRRYHIVFIPCAYNANVAALRDPDVLRNLRRYVEEGGKLYVTDWSGEWVDNVWPAPITLGETIATTDPPTDTPATAYDPTTDTWDPTRFGNADGEVYQSSDAQAVDAALATWLDGQIAPRSDTGGDIGPIDAGRFTTYDNWNWVASLTPMVVGQDEMGNNIVDVPKAWVTGSGSPAAGPDRRPLTVTFHPPGCGRVLFSTYHTAPGTHAGLLPQERVLLYLIMEIGVCVTNPPID